MILSDISKVNVDWTLNKLLSASRASKQYVTRTFTEPAAEGKVFAPWVPRQLDHGEKNPTDLVGDNADQLANDGTASNNYPKQDEDTNADLPQQETIDTLTQTLSEQELETIRMEAFEQGKQEAAAQLDETIGANERRLVELIDQLANARIDLYDLKRTVADLAMFISKQAIRAELTISAQWLDNLVEQCLQEMRLHGNEKITVSLSESDFEAYQSRLSARHSLVTFVSDKKLHSGDIELSMGATRISELMDAKLKLISDQLLTALAGSSDTSQESVDIVLAEDDK